MMEDMWRSFEILPPILFVYVVWEFAANPFCICYVKIVWDFAANPFCICRLRFCRQSFLYMLCKDRLRFCRRARARCYFIPLSHFSPRCPTGHPDTLLASLLLHHNLHNIHKIKKIHSIHNIHEIHKIKKIHSIHNIHEIHSIHSIYSIYTTLLYNTSTILITAGGTNQHNTPLLS